MVNRTKALKVLKDYFETKGGVPTALEYAREQDAPIDLRQVKAFFGSWKRMEKLLMANDAQAPATNGLNVDALIKARNESEYEAARQWKEASENQDTKARREAEAQHVAEVLAANAATPEGANNNKLAIGGKLAHEQQDFSAMGATVKTDANTGEQVIVDAKPEIAKVTNEDPRTPLELRDAASANAGKANVDESAADGSTGTASIATTQALGGETGDAAKVADKSDASKTSTETKKVPAK